MVGEYFELGIDVHESFLWKRGLVHGLLAVEEAVEDSEEEEHSEEVREDVGMAESTGRLSVNPFFMSIGTVTSSSSSLSVTSKQKRDMKRMFHPQQTKA